MESSFPIRQLPKPFIEEDLEATCYQLLREVLLHTGGPPESNSKGIRGIIFIAAKRTLYYTLRRCRLKHVILKGRIYKCKNIFTKMLKDVGMEVPKSIETTSKYTMHADKGRGR